MLLPILNFSEYKFSRHDFIRTEREVLREIEFQTKVVTVDLIIKLLSELANQDAIVYHFAIMIFEFYSAMSWNYLCNHTFDVACSAITLSRYALLLEPWNDALVTVTNITESSFKHLLKHMFSVLTLFSSTSIAKNLKKKFNTPMRKNVGCYYFPNNLNYCEVSDTLLRVPII